MEIILILVGAVCGWVARYAWQRYQDDKLWREIEGGAFHDIEEDDDDEFNDKEEL